MLNIKVLRSFLMVEKRRTLFYHSFSGFLWFSWSWDSFWRFPSEIWYEFSVFFDFVTVFNGLYLDDQKELEKNKIYRDYLLLEKMRFPGFLFVWLQFLTEIRWVKVGGISEKSPCTAPLRRSENPNGFAEDFFPNGIRLLKIFGDTCNCFRQIAREQ